MIESNTPSKKMKIVFAGDRDISVWVLDYLIKKGIKPVALLISDKNRATHADELKKLCSYLDKKHILEGDLFRTDKGVELLSELNADYILGVHFPYIVPKKVLEIPKKGVLNLHPAYLPFNRGWHTPSWAILDDKPYGATLHFMDEGLDTGDIIHQKQIKLLPEDTANSIYKKVKKLEFEVFKKAWPLIENNTVIRKKQNPNEGTAHKKSDLKNVQNINLENEVKAKDLINLLRALTTNDIKEAAQFSIGEKIYKIQVIIKNVENQK